MQLTHLIRHASRVIPVTSNTPNRHTHTTIRAADACDDQGRPIATRITMNTVSAKTRHSCAVRMLRSGIDIAVIALWMGHESTRTTMIYLKADLELKQRALDRTVPVDGQPGRYQPHDDIIDFLDHL